MNTIKTLKRIQTGFTLLEVLVSLVVMSFGMLGAGTLILRAVKSNDSAYMATQATEHASAMLDYLRANNPQVAANRAALIDAYKINPVAAAPGPDAAPDPLCVDDTTCTPEQQAAFDTFNWLTNIAASLPAGQGGIVFRTVGNQLIATITVQWDDSVAQQAFSEVTNNRQVVIESAL